MTERLVATPGPSYADGAAVPPPGWGGHETSAELEFELPTFEQSRRVRFEPLTPLKEIFG